MGSSTFYMLSGQNVVMNWTSLLYVGSSMIVKKLLLAVVEK